MFSWPTYEPETEPESESESKSESKSESDFQSESDEQESESELFAHAKNTSWRAYRKVNNQVLKNISEILQKSDNFYAVDELKFDDLKIKVEGLGKLNFPIREQEVESMIKLSSQAKFGLREKTVLDKNIRDTQEIPSNKLKVTINPESLTRVLDNIRKKFYLSGNSYFLAHLHNLLVYSPGQFFKTHQDTEKCENMIATLVLILPYPHIGGDLIIEHDNKKFAFSSENIAPKDIKCVAFFADCKHEIEKIKQGYRIVMTYNLALHSNNKDEDDYAKSEDEILELQNNIQKYFQETSDQGMQMLVVYLNHQYTKEGLKWKTLKGADRVNVSALVKIAKKLGLVPYLTLVEIYKQYSIDEADTVIECMDKNIKIKHWITEDNKTFNHEHVVSENAICFSGSKKLETYKEEKEGYYGNDGGSLEKWYKCAAIVLIMESDIIPFKFSLNYDYAIQELITLTKNSGNKEKLKNIIINAEKQLFNSKSEQRFSDFAKIVIYLNDKDYALKILKQASNGYGFLNYNVSNSLAKLQIKFGVNWVLKFLNKLKEDSTSRNKLFLKDINSFINEFIKYKGDSKIAEFILEEHLLTFINSDVGETSTSYRWGGQSSHQSNQTGFEKIEKIFLAAIILRKADFVTKVIRHIMSNTKKYSTIDTIEFLCKFIKTISPESKAYFAELKNFLKEKIDIQVAASMWDENDWSITANLRCTCEHCRKVSNFLRSKTDKRLVWPIIQKTRNHIMSVVGNSISSVKVTVERVGSPHRLVIEKTDELHQRSKEKFEKLKIIRQKLSNINT